MYSVIIIDDEQTVREGIRTLLPWEEMGFAITGEVVDGEEGLKVILGSKPDVVLVDVRMPGMTGIELIAETIKAGYKGEFLILSGYSDFKYAKSAITLGVRGYLLKPIDEDELYGYMNDIKKDLDQKREKKEKEAQIEQETEKNREKARQNIIFNLLMKQERIEVIQNEIARFNFDYNYNTFHVIILSNSRFYMNEDYKEKVNLILSGLNKIEYLILGYTIAIIVKGDNIQVEINQLFENNKRMTVKYNDEFFIAVGQEVICLKDICYSYECAQYLTERKFLYGKKNIVSMEGLRQQKPEQEDNYLAELSDCIEIGDGEGIEKNVCSMLEKCRYQLVRESRIKVMIINNAILLINNFKDRYTNHTHKLGDIELFTQQVNQTENLEELGILAVKYCKTISENIGNTGADSIVKRMHVFIQKNYSKDLKLESIAKMFCYNSAYLGKTYKKETGESFNTTLDKVRINNAKELLQNTNLKVYQISEKVGYYNIDYFYSKFKKYVGMTPREFKSVNKLE